MIESTQVLNSNHITFLITVHINIGLKSGIFPLSALIIQHNAVAEKLELYSGDFANVHIQQQPFESPCIQYVRPSKSGKFQRLAAAQKSV